VRQQSGVIPYLVDRGIVKIMIITSRTGRWIFPKGNRIRGLTERESAAREALEEAGVRGTVGARSVGVYHYVKSGVAHDVVLYPLRIKKILSVWEESSQRARMFGMASIVVKRLEYAALRKIAKKLCQMLRRDGAAAQGSAPCR
jgi:ADP-ribose pyrophosphatase YjhB (NUDIX family)